MHSNDINDNDIKNLLSKYEPQQSPDSLFMARLRENLDKVEIVKRANADFRRRSRRAVVVAAFAGMMVGALLTLLLPLFGEFLADFTLRIPFTDMAWNINDSYDILAWIIVAVATLFSSIGIYDLAMTRLWVMPKEKK